MNGEGMSKGTRNWKLVIEGEAGLENGEWRLEIGICAMFLSFLWVDPLGRSE